MSTDEQSENLGRIDAGEEFRRKKRNLLAVGTLGAGFAISATGLSIGLPGFSEAKVSSTLVSASLLIYLLFTGFEFYHEYRHLIYKYSRWSRQFSDTASVSEAIRNVVQSLNSVSNLLDNAKISVDFRRQQLSNDLLGCVGRLNDLVRILNHNIITETNSEGEWATESIIRELPEILPKIQDITDEISATSSDIQHRNTEMFREQYAAISRTANEVKDMLGDGRLPAADHLTSLSNTLYRSDRLMTRVHDGWAPLTLGLFALIALIVDIVQKVSMYGFDAVKLS
ncbi:MAG: hypothetical protein WA940_12565 [Sphingopyxis sp.]